jgi:hypothetical protein
MEIAARKLVGALRSIELPVPMVVPYKYTKLILGPIGLWKARAVTLRI